MSTISIDRLFDIKQVMFDTNVPNGLHSVTDGKVGFHTQYNGIRTVACATHGAMLCVAIMDRVGGRIYRCPTCNEGAVRI